MKGNMQPRSQEAKRLDAREATGVGIEVGNHSVILNDYDNNTVNNDDLSGRGYNLIVGTNNTLTYCARNSVSGGWNSLTNTQDSYVSGQGNEVTGGYGEIVGGHLNKLTGGSLGNIVGGQDNTGTQCTADIIGGQDNTVSRTRNALITGDNSTVNAAHNSIVGGEGHTVSGENNIVAGDHNAHIGSNAMTIGQNNTNTARNSLALGMYGYNQSALLNIGYGSLGNYNNVFYIDTSGAAYAANGYHAIGADYAEYFEWTDGNPEGEDRRGMLVSLDGDRIVPAHGDDILGAVSAYPSVIGNAFEEHWQGKYKHDIFGAPIYDEEGHQIIADGFDPDREYIPRSKRPEWAAIGMVGRLIVTDDGRCAPGGNVSARQGIAVPTLSRTNVRCLKRVDETHIEVLIK